ncbi:MAG TPA: sulfotransferase family 2 domain-containing protein [Verrucomicrobiae bacterium]|nr:sulfotransferase family 2 domain-containing protein [Verrucomicrobiae bacterium]
MIVFLHIHKTGGTTFRSILEKNFGASCCHTNQTRREMFSQADLEFVKKVFPGLNAITGHNLVDPLRFSVPSPFYATFMREPVARVISHYQHVVLGGKKMTAFEDSLREISYLNNWQVKLMAGGENLDKAKRFLERCDFIGLTEKFNLSLQVFGKLAPSPLNLNYKRLIVAKNDKIQKTLLADPRMLELAREHNKLDLELYAFALNEIFPKLCRKAGVNPADKAASYDIPKNDMMVKYKFGRIYNKIFRQVYKVRNAIFNPNDTDLPAAKL